MWDQGGKHGRCGGVMVGWSDMIRGVMGGWIEGSLVPRPPFPRSTMAARRVCGSWAGDETR